MTRKEKLLKSLEYDGLFITMADLPPDPREKKKLKEYKNLGLNTYVMTEDSVPLVKDGKLSKKYKKALDNVKDAGLYLMIRNMFNDKDYFDLKKSVSRLNVESPFEMEPRHITDEFKDYPNLIGFYMMDEPFWYTPKEKEWYPSFDKLSKLIKFQNKYYQDKIFHVNHVPSSSWDHYYPVNDTFHTYSEFIDAYEKEVLTKVKGEATLSVDNYPFIGENYMEENYLFDLLSFANKARDYKRTLNICIQAFEANSANMDGRHRDIESKEEIMLQVNTALALGAKSLEYFRYREDGYSKSIMNQDGTKRIYDIVKEGNDLSLPTSKYISSFDFLGLNAYSSSSVQCEYGKGFIKSKDLFLKDMGCLDVIKTDYDIIVGRFKKGDFSGYMVVNFTDPKKNRCTNVEMKFNGFKELLIIMNGVERIVPILNEKIILVLDKGEGAFIVPLD